MARFDVYLISDGPGYLLDIQANFLEDLNTRVVAPLMERTEVIPSREGDREGRKAGL
jgi:toxin CcdB